MSLSSLLFAEDKIDDPAPANVWTGAATVFEDLPFLTAGVLECVREDRHRAELARIVHLPRERNYGIGAPFGSERNRAKRVAENISEESHLARIFRRGIPSTKRVVLLDRSSTEPLRVRGRIETKSRELKKRVLAREGT